MAQNDNYDVIIIGAGIGGLTAGNILAKNGKKVLILEKNYAPGGGVGTFMRNGYPIDISHALCAFKEDACLRKYLEYIGIFNKLELVELEKSFVYSKGPKEKPILCYVDLVKYAEELKKYFPDEYVNVKKFFEEITEIWYKEVLKSYYNPSLFLKLLYPFLFPRVFKYRNYTFEQFLNGFNFSSELKEVISVGWPYLGMEKEFVSALYMICLFGAYHCDKTYFIKGGFGKLVDVLTENFKKIGGELIFNTEIEKILLNKRKAAYGVKDKKGNIFLGGIIVSNADSKKTFLELLDKDTLPKRFLNKVNKMFMTRSAIQVHIFAQANINNNYLSAGSIALPYHIDVEKKLRLALKSETMPYEKPVLILSIHRLENFNVNCQPDEYAFNVCWYPADHQLWKNYYEKFGKREYETVKAEIGQMVLNEIKKEWDIKAVKFMHVMTPISLEKWLNATSGAIYDLAVTPKQSLLNRMKHKTPVKNLYLVGTKTFPGNGMAGALFSSFAFCDIILKRKLTNGKMIL